MCRPSHHFPRRYDRSRPLYSSSLDSHPTVDPHHNTHPPPFPVPGYNPSQQLQHSDTSYKRRKTLHHAPPTPGFAPIPGMPSDYTTQSVPVDDRNRKPFPSLERHTNGEAPPVRVHPTQYDFPAARFFPTHEPVLYLDQAGAKRKPGRAQQVN